MNKKGFTLVEILVVISLLAIFSIAIGITLNLNMKKQQENEIKDFNQKIKGAANLYVTNNSDILTNIYEEKGYIIIKLKELINSGLISDNLRNPSTNKSITGNELIKAELDESGTIIIEFPILDFSEDYLQTKNVIIELGSTIEDICYKDINSDSLKYISNKTVPSNYLQYEGDSITIKCDSSHVKETEKGTYEIEYEYKTLNGIWKRANRDVIIQDSTPPTVVLNVTTSEWTNEDVGLYGYVEDFGTNIKNVSLYNGDAFLGGLDYNPGKTRVDFPLSDGYKIDAEGEYAIKLTAIDYDNNLGESEVKAVRIDKTKPTMSLSVPNGTTYATSKTATVTLKDTGGSGLSGTYKIKYAWSTNEVTCNNMTSEVNITATTGASIASNTITISGNTGNGKLYVCNKENVTDRAGNILNANTTISADMYLDNANPKVEVTAYKYVNSTKGDKVKDTSTFTSNGTYKVDPNETGWVNYGVYFEFKNSSLSGIKSIQWKWNKQGIATDSGDTYNGGSNTLSSPNINPKYAYLSGQGYRKGQWIVESNTGKKTIVTVIVGIDTDVPRITLKSNDGTDYTHISFKGTEDKMSGLASQSQYAITSGTSPYNVPSENNYYCYKNDNGSNDCNKRPQHIINKMQERALNDLTNDEIKWLRGTTKYTVTYWIYDKAGNFSSKSIDIPAKLTTTTTTTTNIPKPPENCSYSQSYPGCYYCERIYYSTADSYIDLEDLAGYWRNVLDCTWGVTCNVAYCNSNPTHDPYGCKKVWWYQCP